MLALFFVHSLFLFLPPGFFFCTCFFALRKLAERVVVNLTSMQPFRAFQPLFALFLNYWSVKGGSFLSLHISEWHAWQ